MRRNTQVLLVITLLLASVATLTVVRYDPAAPSENSEKRSYDELNDSEKLERIESEENRRSDEQWYDRAQRYGSESYCDNIQDDALRVSCKGGLEVASASSIEPLQGVSTNDERRFYYAVEQEDASLCDTITDEDLRAFCFDEA